jgi:hypothetical protein
MGFPRLRLWFPGRNGADEKDPWDKSETFFGFERVDVDPARSPDAKDEDGSACLSIIFGGLGVSLMAYSQRITRLVE